MEVLIMRSPISYILSVFNQGGKIIVTTSIKLYDNKGNFVCCLSDRDLQQVREAIESSI
jgi:hypothetical protein